MACVLLVDIILASPLPASPATVNAAAGDDGGDDVKLTSVNTTSKPACSGDMEFLSYKPTQYADYK